MREDFEEINAIIAGIGRVIAEWSTAPKLMAGGSYIPTLEQAKEQQSLLDKIEYNERQIIAKNESLLNSDDPIPYLETEFASILARRNLGETVPSLTVGTFLCCPARSQLLVQQRSEMSAYFPGRFSMFGGHITLDNDDSESELVVENLVKEVKEETGADLNEITTSVARDLPVSLTIQEIPTGSIQFTPLCFAISETLCKSLIKSSESMTDRDSYCNESASSNEGSIVAMPFKELNEAVKNPDLWSPIAYSTIVAWIYFGMTVQPSWQGELIDDEVTAYLKSCLFF